MKPPLNKPEFIRVVDVGPYGPKVGDTYYRCGKVVSPNMFVAGHTYAVQVGVAKDGTKFINKIDTDLGLVSGAETPATSPLNPALNQAPTPAPVDNRPRRAGFDKPLTEYDLMIQAQISVAGLLQASMQAVASQVSGVDKLISESQRVTEAQLAWVKQTVANLLQQSK